MDPPFFLLILVIVLSSLFLEQHKVCSLFINCGSVRNCFCTKEDVGGWRIECPDEFRSTFPIVLKVQRLNTTNNYEAAISMECGDDDAPDPSGNRTDPWSYAKGVDFSVNQINSKIVRLEIRRCPIVQDGWKNLLKQLNLTGSDIRHFSFAREYLSDPTQIPSNFFKEMPNIENLTLRNNKLQQIPDVSMLDNLRKVNLRYNEIRSILSGAFTKNTQLTTVVLTQNNISEISPKAFPESLEHLELYTNEISSLNASTFANLKNLKRLYLNNNKLDDVDANTFDGMPALEELLLYNSQMTQFPNFRNLDKLAKLRVSSAILYRYIPDQADVTTTLAPDYLPQNQLTLQNLPSLESLQLTLNHFAVPPVLENLPKLVEVDLGRNEITEIESGAFSGLPALKRLNLSRNQIKKLGGIRASSLVELDVSSNSLTELRNDTFNFLEPLKQLNLAKNQIATIAPRTFESLRFLEELDLSNNQVTFSSAPAATSPQNEYFSFGSSNQSPLQWSSNLKKLLLSHNQIAKLDFSDWRNLFIQINEIDLSYNKITTVHAQDFNFIAWNLTLNLEHNNISTIDLRLSFLLETNEDPTKEIRVLLGGNPLDCDCYAYKVKVFNLESFRLQTKNITCASPPSLQGVALIEVPDRDLICNLDEEMGCPGICECRERTVDKTVIVDCSERNLTSEEIPKLDTFKGVYKDWMVELDLSDNGITNFNNAKYMRQFFNKTRHVNLTGNKLTSTQFLENVPEYQETTFAIADNPFPCENCVGFQIPWRAFPNRISDLGNVTCRKVVESSLILGTSQKYELLFVQQNSKEFENFCTASGRLSVVVILPLVVAVIFLSCLCVGLFVTIRYGWAIKAFLYSKGLDWCLFWERDVDADDNDGTEKLYDAFVSYSHKDEEWVIDELVKRLEDNEGFKLCLHFRDWTPGDWIPDQIVRSVDKSRRTIVILSKNFVESVWSRLEFKAAHAQALKERSSRVILILLGEELKEADVHDDDLKMYMKMNTFMKWNDPLFWHRLKYALPHNKKSNLTSANNQHATEEQKQNSINKMQQRDRAIKLDKLRAKLEQNV